MIKKVIKYFSIIFTFMLTFFSFGCKQNIFNQTYLMTSSLPFFVSVESTNNIKSVKDELQNLINEFEYTFDTKKENSIITKVNNALANEKILVNKQFVDLFNLSKTYYLENNNFNPSLYPIIKLWGLDNFTTMLPGTELDKIPTESEIDALLPYCKMENFVVELIDNNYYVTKQFDKCELDFGGIAKGYFSDIATKFLEDKNVKNSMINYAGNIKYSVTKNMYIPKIQIKNSVKNSLIEIDLKNKCSAVVTSGHYQRYFTYNGEIISHILNKFGRQGEKEISGVTVIDASGAKSDVYATIACLLKKDDAISFLNSKNVLYFIVDKDGKVVKNF